MIPSSQSTTYLYVARNLRPANNSKPVLNIPTAYVYLIVPPLSFYQRRQSTSVCKYQSPEGEGVEWGWHRIACASLIDRQLACRSPGVPVIMALLVLAKRVWGWSCAGRWWWGCKLVVRFSAPRSIRPSINNLNATTTKMFLPSRVGAT